MDERKILSDAVGDLRKLADTLEALSNSRTEAAMNFMGSIAHLIPDLRLDLVAQYGPRRSEEERVLREAIAAWKASGGNGRWEIKR